MGSRSTTPSKMGGGSSKKNRKDDGEGPLSNSELNDRKSGSTATETFRLEKENMNFRYAVVSQRGYYPESKSRHVQYILDSQFVLNMHATTSSFKPRTKKTRIVLLLGPNLTTKIARPSSGCLTGMVHAEKNVRALLRKRCLTSLAGI